MTNQNTPQNPRRTQRNRQQNATLLAIAATFVALLLVFAILLGIGAVRAIRGDGTPDPDAGLENNDTNQPSDGNDSGGTGNENQNGGNTQEPPKMISVPSSSINKGSLVLVNATHVYTFPDITLLNVYMTQATAQTLSKYFQMKDATLFMEQDAYQAMNKMLTAFSEQTGLCDVQLIAAYRSFEQQNSLSSTIKGGYSDHHTGMTFALNVYKANGKAHDISTLEEYRWIYDNCYKYGIVPRYPLDKFAQTGVNNYAECFRYVGYVHAYVMTTKNLCLEEYIPYLQSHTYGDGALKVTTDDGSSYEIYYVAATGTTTEVPVPDHGNYTISGDNEGGFIVTVKLS